MELRGRVAESAMPHVYCQAKVVQKVCTQNGLFDIGTNEYPPEGAAQPNVESAGAYTKGRNLRTVNSLQGESTWRTGAFNVGRGNNADLSTCINEKTSITITVMYVKEATMVGGAGDTCRR